MKNRTTHYHTPNVDTVSYLLIVRILSSIHEEFLIEDEILVNFGIKQFSFLTDSSKPTIFFSKIYNCIFFSNFPTIKKFYFEMAKFYQVKNSFFVVARIQK